IPAAEVFHALAPVALVAIGLGALRYGGGRLASIAPALISLMVGADLLASLSALNPTTSAELFRTRPPLSAVLPRGARLYVSDYSIAPASAALRRPAGVPYLLKQIPTGATIAEGVTLAA